MLFGGLELVVVFVIVVCVAIAKMVPGERYSDDYDAMTNDAAIDDADAYNTYNSEDDGWGGFF